MSTDRPPYMTAERGPLQRVLAIAAGVLVVLLAVFMIFPFVWMLLTSFRTQQEIFSNPGNLIPAALNWSAYVEIWSELPFARLFLNSIIFAGGTTLISLLFDSLSAYALARLTFPAGPSPFTSSSRP